MRTKRYGEKFAEYKTNTGIPAKALGLWEINRDFDGNDTAERIKKAIKHYLNEDQFKALLDYLPPKEFNYDVYYDMFVFSCYAGGLRFFDVFELQWKHYSEQEERLTKIIHKSKRKHQFKLPQQAIDILEKVLKLTEEENFPIGYLYQLTHEIDKIWPFDPDFVGSIYKSVFSHYETSKEKTDMGTPVLPLSSTRRQDYHMCQYSLIKNFPKYLRTAPSFALPAIINCLNFFIISQIIPIIFVSMIINFFSCPKCIFML